MDGNRVYVGSVYEVTALDISNPKAPAILASWPVAYPARGLAVPLPGRVVAVCGLGGLYQWELKQRNAKTRRWRRASAPPWPRAG